MGQGIAPESLNTALQYDAASNQNSSCQAYKKMAGNRDMNYVAIF